jgi:hypothetical protein
MNEHAELQMLSAFLDGELDTADRARVEAHLQSCSDCREVYDGIQATVSELRGDAEPVPSEQDSWALRASIASARRAESSKRLPRFLIAGAGVAASIVAVIAFVSTNNTAGDKSALFGTASAPQAFADDYNEASARELLAPTRTAAEAMHMRSAPSAAPGGAGGDVSGNYQADSGATAPDACLKTVQPKDGALTQTFSARFKGTPAIFYIFEVPGRDPERVELWVTSAVGCDTLFFAQRAL